MDALRCPPPDAEVSVLSGGERRRVALCALLLSQPDLLLLDEPTNHLDAESVLWLEQHLEKYAGTVVAVTHDRYFLDNVAQWILELDRGHAYPYEGNYSTYLETKAARLKIEGQKDAKRRKLLEDELEWVRSNPRARQAKSRARLQRYDEMAAEADARRKVDFEEIQIPPGPRLGRLVVETQGLAKGFGDRMLIEDLSFSLPQGGIVGIIGPERRRQDHADEDDHRGRAAGRGHDHGRRHRARSPTWTRTGHGSTRTRTSGRSSPTARPRSGSARPRSPAAPTWPRSGSRVPTSRNRLACCPAAERNRVNLALTLKQGGNLLLLDEPTNDLDVETLSSLENALLDFPGCAVITSHDRWFLDRVATHILAWEGGASWFWFEGNFEGYEKNKIERLGAEAARPHRVTYRKLTRG